MLAHYQRLAVIDTGAYDLPAFLEEADTIAQALGLERKVVAGSLGYLKKLLTGPWDEGFVRIDPGETITLEHLNESRQEEAI